MPESEKEKKQVDRPPRRTQGPTYQMAVPSPEGRSAAENQRTLDTINTFKQPMVRPTAQINRYQARQAAAQQRQQQAAGDGGQYGGLDRKAILGKLASMEGPEFVSYETNPTMDWRTAAQVNAQRQQGHDHRRSQLVNMLTQAPSAPAATPGTSLGRGGAKATAPAKDDRDERRQAALSAVQRLLEGGASYTPEMGHGTIVTEGGKKVSASAPLQIGDMSAGQLENLANKLAGQGGGGDDTAYQRALDIVKNTPETITNADGVAVANPAHAAALEALRNMAQGGTAAGAPGQQPEGQSRADAYVTNNQVVEENYNPEQFRDMQGTGRGNFAHQPQAKPDLAIPQQQPMPGWDDTLAQNFGDESPIETQVSSAPLPPQGRSRNARAEAAKLNLANSTNGVAELGESGKPQGVSFNLHDTLKKRIEQLRKDYEQRRLR
jgi:hypothetical protein